MATLRWYQFLHISWPQYLPSPVSYLISSYDFILHFDNFLKTCLTFSNFSLWFHFMTFIFFLNQETQNINIYSANYPSYPIIHITFWKQPCILKNMLIIDATNTPSRVISDSSQFFHGFFGSLLFSYVFKCVFQNTIPNRLYIN